MTRPETRPEEVIPLPLSAVNDEAQDYSGQCVALGYDTPEHIDCTVAAALVTMCNAYPLALKLAEAAQEFSTTSTYKADDALRAAIAAFLAHRQEATR